MDTNWEKKRSRPKTTWRRTVLKELEEMDLDLMERSNSQSTGRVQWRCMTAALCPSRGAEDKWVKKNHCVAENCTLTAS